MQVIHIYLIPTYGLNVDEEKAKWEEIKKTTNKTIKIVHKDSDAMVEYNKKECIVMGYNHNDETYNVSADPDINIVEYIITKEDCNDNINNCTDSTEITKNNNGLYFKTPFYYLYIYDFCTNGQATVIPSDKFAIELHLYTSRDNTYSRNIENFISAHKQNIHAIYINDIPLTTYASSYKKAKSAIGAYKEIKDIAEELGISAMSFMKA
jgi:hypothetical protein